MSVLFGLYISKLRIREIGGTSVRDQYGRTVDYIRVSITDRLQSPLPVLYAGGDRTGIYGGNPDL